MEQSLERAGNLFSEMDTMQYVLVNFLNLFEYIPILISEIGICVCAFSVSVCCPFMSVCVFLCLSVCASVTDKRGSYG